MATFKDIRQLTGLSLATISKHYNGGNVREENRVAIEHAAAALGYRINTVASNLRSGRSRTIGVLLPSLANDYHMSVVARLERDLRSTGVSVIVTSAQEESAQHRSVDLLLGRMVDAIVAVPAPDIVEDLRQAVAAGVPVVCFDWQDERLVTDQVTLDNTGAGKIAARHLLDHGHRRVGVISGTPTVSTMHDRAVGFLDGLANGNADAAPELSVNGPLTVAHGHQAMRALLELDQRPTAVFTVNYELTVGALIALNESGLRLGADISMIGFDNTDLARVTRPVLTVIAQPVEKIGSAIASIVSTRLSSDASDGQQHRQLRARLSVGASVARLR